jgi:hypothetical protein
MKASMGTALQEASPGIMLAGAELGYWADKQKSRLPQSQVIRQINRRAGCHKVRLVDR